MSETPTSFGEDVPAAPLPVAGPSALDGLFADFVDAQAEHETTEFDVPGKPGVTIKYANDIPYEMVAAWRKSAQGAPAPELQGGLTLLAYACRGLLVDGEPVTDAEGPVTFTSKSLQARLGAASAADAARAFYGKDGYVLATTNAVLIAAGYAVEVSPTKR